LRTAEREKAVLQRDCDATAEEIKEQKKLQQKITAIKEILLYLDLLDDYLGKFRLELAGRIRPLIALHASELLALMTNSRYTQIELDQDYNIFIYDGASAFPIARFSGGEQDLANLCLRIAISRVVAERRGGSPISFIALDEIFGSQDLERRDLILNALGKLAGQFRQIFIITHIEAIRDLLPTLIMVERADDRCSRAKFI